MSSTEQGRGYDIAVVPGDGIGPEVTRPGVRILEAAAERFGFAVRIESFDWGSDRYLDHGEMMPADGVDTLADFDAILFGAVGDAARVPDAVSLAMLLSIRRRFDQYVNLRPVRLYHGVDTPVATADPETLDFVVVRENTEGEYTDAGGVLRGGTPDAVAFQTAVFTRWGCERVMRYAFDLARSRRKPGGSTVTNCSKSNALRHSMVFWDSVYEDVAADYPDVGRDFALVDALAMHLVVCPEGYDVIVASNLFGDILTDLAAVLQGGMGFAASGNINPEQAHPSMFEPVHGSAPGVAGTGRANPVAAIRSVAMLLEHLGETGAAVGVDGAIAEVLRRREVRTFDMGGKSTTREMGEAILKTLCETV